MATLAELRAKVRSQTQTDDSILTDSEIDSWLQEAFDRTIAAETQWPFYEHFWSKSMLTGSTSFFTLPTDGSYEIDVPGIISVVDNDNSRRLRYVAHEWAVENFSTVSSASAFATNGTFDYYSVFGGFMYLWPLSNIEGVTRIVLITGYRKPIDWISLGASAEPDCDKRMHLALANYAIALAYAQQEDESLERDYMERWQKDVEMAHSVIMRAPRHRPLMMGPRFITPIGRGYAGDAWDI